jgi:hypothetical protein
MFFLENKLKLDVSEQHECSAVNIKKAPKSPDTPVCPTTAIINLILYRM